MILKYINKAAAVITFTLYVNMAAAQTDTTAAQPDTAALQPVTTATQPGGTAAQTDGTVVESIDAVVGNKIILKSDVENAYQQFLSQGNYGNELVRCQVLDQLLLNKLLLNQAALDSVEVTEAQVQGELDSRMAYYIQQIGGEKNLEDYYQKSIPEIKEEFRPLIRDQLQIRAMQSKIAKNASASPADVRAFFESIPPDSLPYMNAEIEYAQIIRNIPVSEEEKESVRQRLEGYRSRIMNGEEFSTLAILYSQDGSAKKGGELGFTNRGELVPEFEAVAFKLKAGEVSQVVETKFGFHLIQMIERRGDQINVRHILIKPTVSEADIRRTATLMDSISDLLKNGVMTFGDAAGKFSDDAETRYNGGNVINPQTGNTRFEPEQVDPTVFFILDKLVVETYSSPSLSQTPEGGQIYRMLYLKARSSPHRANLVDDYQRLQEQALMSKQNKIMEDWVQKKKKSTYIKISDEYKFCDNLKYWMN